MLRVEIAVYLAQGDRLTFYFARTGAGIQSRIEFEGWVNAAASSAQEQLDAAQQREVHERTAAPDAKKPRVVATREKKGTELRSVLREVGHLRDRGKWKAADEKLGAAAGGAPASKRTVRRRAGEVADLIFASGGLDTIRAVMDSLLDRADVRHVLQKRQRRRARC